MAESTITSKGQITIPKVVRERLHLDVGDTVYFDLRPDGSVVLMARNTPVESLFGLLKQKGSSPLSVDDMNPASLPDE
jgi:AbrB family looped-hinge helix DNA binding protein